jgi:hypothetical protein
LGDSSVKFSKPSSRCLFEIIESLTVAPQNMPNRTNARNNYKVAMVVATIFESWGRLCKGNVLALLATVVLNGKLLISLGLKKCFKGCLQLFFIIKIFTKRRKNLLVYLTVILLLGAMGNSKPHSLW